MCSIKKAMIASDQKQEQANTIVKHLRENGHEAYFVGGCVRDMLLGRTVEEIDIATDASQEAIGTLFPKSRLVGNVFPVVQVRKDKHIFEIATYRSDGNKPTMKEQDAAKRDFTCNSLFYDPETGEILDTVGGQKDLKAKHLKFNDNPMDRISEDPCRMLRGIRLAVHYGFEIEKASFEAIQKKAATITSVSAERIMLELEKIWLSDFPEQGLRLLASSGLLKHVLPEVEELQGVEQPEHYHPEGDVFEHTCQALRHMPKPVNRQLAWAVVLHDIGKPRTQTFEDRIHFKGHEKVGEEMAKQVLQRLRADNKLINAIQVIIHYHGQFHHIQQMKKSTLKRMFARETFDDELQLHYADKMAGNQDLQYYNFAKTRKKELSNEAATLEKAFELINGHDLEAIGFIPGPLFRHVLKDIRDAFLENEIRTREEALQMATSLLEKYRNN